MKCCGIDSRFVDNGPRLQYYFCDECRKEVNESTGIDLPEQVVADPVPPVYAPFVWTSRITSAPTTEVRVLMLQQAQNQILYLPDVTAFLEGSFLNLIALD